MNLAPLIGDIILNIPPVSHHELGIMIIPLQKWKVVAIDHDIIPYVYTVQHFTGATNETILQTEKWSYEKA